MASRRRKAEFEATLIFIDEPLLIALKAGKQHVVAVAIPDDDPDKAMFLATTVTPPNWEGYFNGNSDLRFLFTYPKNRLLYYFDLMSMKDNKVSMEPTAFHDIPEDHLPSPRVFATEHTHEYSLGEKGVDEEKLEIDGEWEMPQFGAFYQKYSDVYAFMASTINWRTGTPEVKVYLSKVYQGKPFEGGSSYVHFYKDLNGGVVRNQRAGLEMIKYNSPGEVLISGKRELFDSVETLIEGFLDNREKIGAAYNALHQYLSKNKYLQMSGHNYPKNDPTSAFIKNQTELLAREIADLDVKPIQEMSGNNALVVAKIVLSLCRRVEDAAEFFAQGRMSYT
jgi:hypothetical protein